MATLSRHKIKNTFSDEIEGVPRSPSHKSRIWKLKMWWRTLICQHQIHNNVFIGAYVLRPHLIAGAFIGLSLSPYFWPPLESGLRWWDGGGLPSHRSRRLRRRPVSPNPAENSQAEKFRRKFRESATNTKAALRTLPLKHFDFKSVYVLCVF